MIPHHKRGNRQSELWHVFVIHGFLGAAGHPELGGLLVGSHLGVGVDGGLLGAGALAHTGNLAGNLVERKLILVG